MRLEAWEEELDLAFSLPAARVKPWEELRAKIKDELKKRHKLYSITNVNKFMILTNFTTLRIKGVSRIQASLKVARQWRDSEGVWFARRIRALARHYQTFERLPVDHRGGHKNALSHFDEAVQRRAREYLADLPTGKVTPKGLQKAINEIIFPELGIKPKQPISVQTARRWLIRLGWRHTQIRKGVYMDGHECDDVKKYRKEVFLPQMKEYERLMTHFDGPDLDETKPNLAEGEKEIIPCFHDESIFHHNDYSAKGW